MNRMRDGKERMEKGLVSIVIPCYNGEEYLKRLFDSLLDQTYQKLQIIFANDGSTDDTVKIAESYKGRFAMNNMELVILSQENKGQAAAVNLGFSYVKGEYFMWIDSDDYLEAEHVQRKLAFLEENEQIDVVMAKGNIYNEDDLTKVVGVLGGEAPVGTLFQDILYAFRSCQCGLYMIRTKALFEALPEKKIYESAVGQNMQILLPTTVNNRVGYIPDKLYNYVVRAESHSRAFKGGIQWRQRLDVLEDMKRHVLGEMQISDEFRDKLLERLAFQMNIMRMRKIDKELALHDRAYVEKVCQLFLEYSNLFEYLNGRAIYIWGMGDVAVGMITVLEDILNLQVVGIIESKAEKAGIIWNEKPVIYKEEISKEDMYILVPLKAHKDVRETLAAKEFDSRRDFFYPEYELRDAVEGDKYEYMR